MVAGLLDRSNGLIAGIARFGSRPVAGFSTGLKIRFAVVVGMTMVLCFSGLSAAEVPYRNYAFDFFGNTVPAPQAYLPKSVITGTFFLSESLRIPKICMSAETGRSSSLTEATTGWYGSIRAGMWSE